VSALRIVALVLGCAAATAACIPAADESEEVLIAQGQVAIAEPAPEVAVVNDVAPQTVTPPAASGPADFVVAGELEQGGWIRGQAPFGTVTARLGEQELALDEEGQFFAAFDRDAESMAQLVAVRADGSTLTKDLTVAARNWQIERVNVARRPGGASESFMRRRQPELDAIWDARTANSAADGWREDFIWPVTGRISGRFGSQRIYRGEPGSYHSGLDIAGSTGTPFVAPASGKVTLATSRPYSLEGYLLIIDHGDGLNSAFLHLSEILVDEGEFVEQGQLIGRIGSSGRATGPHLHWSIKWHLARLDPLLFVGPMP